MLSRHPAVAGLPLIADWGRLGRPAVVRRRLPGEAADGVPAAVPLPPALGKRRVAFSFPAGAGLTRLPPVLLRDAAPFAPAAWGATIDELLAIGAAVASPPRVFGALLWQHQTGLAYLSATSDIDLLWAPRDAPTTRHLLDRLRALEERSPVRLDGEVECPDGAGVAWRELADAPPGGEVLAKTLGGVELRSTARLFPEAA